MVYHLWSQYSPADPDTERRQKIAYWSWAKQPWRELPIVEHQLKRLWIENDKRVPFIKDLFDVGCRGSKDDDIVCYTNADILVRSDACLQIAAALQETDAAYSYRFDFHHHVDKVPPDSHFSSGIMYPGSDLVAFRVCWWRRHQPEMPDMVVSFEATDPVLRTLIDQTCLSTAPNEIVGICCHERHSNADHWEQPHNRYKLKGQLYNLSLAKAFFNRRNMDASQFGIR